MQMRMITAAGVLLLPLLLSAQVSFYDFTVTDIRGEEFDLAQLQGKKVFVVNTASECSLSPQFKSLEKLYRRYGGDDFTIIGFPCNDFGGREPGTDEEIAAYCKETYDISFPMMSRITIRGGEMHPLYRWLTRASENGVEDSKVAWNFQKYLIDEHGTLAGHLPPQKKPTCKEIVSWLKE